MMPSYPLTVSIDGGLTISTDEIGEQILSLVDCQYFERAMFVDFGFPMTAFDPIGSEDLGLQILQVQLEINTWIGENILVENVSTNIDDGTVEVSISHQD